MAKTRRSRRRHRQRDWLTFAVIALAAVLVVLLFSTF